MLKSVEEMRQLRRASASYLESGKDSRARIVRFSDTTSFHVLTTGHEQSAFDGGQLWYSKKELRCIKKRNKVLASECSKPAYRRHSLDSHPVHGADFLEQIAAQKGDTCRGLELHINPLQRKLSKEIKSAVRQSVFEEQIRQLEQCEVNPLMIAEVARETSFPAQHRACIQGQMDELEVLGQRALAMSLVDYTWKEHMPPHNNRFETNPSSCCLSKAAERNHQKLNSTELPSKGYLFGQSA